jgi:hypothetical protein
MLTQTLLPLLLLLPPGVLQARQAGARSKLDDEWLAVE